MNNNMNNMNKSKYYQLFNNKMTEFIKDLINVFPEDKDFKLFKNSFDLLKLNKEDQPCKVFSSVIQKFKDQILNKDENFFLKRDYNDVMEVDPDVTTSLIDKLKNYWIELGNDKEIIWNYLILLIKISDKCI
jgi:hypothetical protein